MTDAVPAALDRLRAGGLVVVARDEPDGLGELVAAGALLSEQAATFMATHGGGIIYVALPRQRCEQLKLHAQNPTGDTSRWESDMRVAVDATEGITTGISAADRARTVRVLADPQARPDSVARPGHIVPLAIKDDGLWERADLGEAGVDLVMLAGFSRAAADCELLNDDGSRMRGKELRGFAERHALPYVTVSEVLRHRARHEAVAHARGSLAVDVSGAAAELHVFDERISRSRRYLLETGSRRAGAPTLVGLVTVCELAALRLGGCECARRAAELIDQLRGADHGVLVLTGAPPHGCPLSQFGADRERGYDPWLDGMVVAHMLRARGIAEVIYVGDEAPRLSAVEELGIAVRTNA